MKPQLVVATEEHAQVASELVRDSFQRFVAVDWEPHACEAFLREASIEKLREGIPTGTYAALAQLGEKFVGFIYLPRPTLLAMLFVHHEHLGRGIGRLLWEAARTHIEANHADIKTVELNASPYGVAAYRAMGFYPISEPFHRAGAVATRMACWLPGRALAAAANAA